MISLFEPSFIDCLPLTFVVNDEPTDKSSPNFSKDLYVLFENLSNLRIGNAVGGSS